MKHHAAWVMLPAWTVLAGCGCGELDLGGGEEDADVDVDAFVDDTFAMDPNVDAGEFSWTPPIDNLGEPGWRSSTDPWCPGVGQPVFGFDVWSFEGGVYAVIVDCVETPEVNHLYFNDGTGWSLVYEAVADNPDRGSQSCLLYIMGASSGPLYAWAGPSRRCHLGIIEDGNVQWGEFSVIEAFIVNVNLAYAIATFGDIKIIQYDGTTWSPVPADVPYEVLHIWADEENVFAVGTGGTIVSLEDGEWRIHDSGTVDYITAVWGFAGDDVWVGQNDGTLRHFDGNEWTPVEWPNMGPSTTRDIRGMWGMDGVLFFHTASQLTMWDGSEFTVLGQWSAEGNWIQAIWGNSPTEVFLAVVDEGHVSADCGPEYLLWWDGSEFHWF